MEISIADKLLKTYKLSDNDFLMLYLIGKECNLKTIIKTLLDKQYIQESILSDSFELTSEGKRALEYLQVNGNKDIIDKEKELENLAITLKNLYPKGKKPGTNYLWRGNTIEITKRLKVLVGKYKFKFTPEQAIKATKDYISSFNGDYTMMRLLKYFILKLERDADGNTNVVSDLMTLIENEGQENVNNDWTTNLV